MKLKKIMKLFEKGYMNKTQYIKYIDKLSIDEKAILIDSQHGADINGNMFYILKELHKEAYNDYKIYVSVDNNNQNEFVTKLNNYNLNNLTLIKYESKNYFKILATAKYLFNDTSFLSYFIKREEQVYFNTWHGTPLKTLGKSVKDDFHLIGNIQKNFLFADYLLYPSEYMMNHMLDDYMIKNIGKAKIVLEGYPRNSVFLDEKRRAELKRIINPNNKQIIAYMPTWRGTLKNIDDEGPISEIKDILNKVDSKLNKNQVSYVNMHPFVKNRIDLTIYKNIKSFPKEYETYDFLNTVDILITDYSSVFFDYALTKNKIVLFTYDKELYFKNRGVYFELDELPFPKVDTIDDLVKEINSPKNYKDEEFLNKFCKYETIDSSKRIIDLVLKNETKELKVLDMPNNDKKNILIYAGNLAKNGITTSLFNLLNNIAIDKYNIYISFKGNVITPYKDTILNFPKGVNYISELGKLNLTLFEKILTILYYKNIIKYEKVKTLFDKRYKQEIKRLYGNTKFDAAIHFSGYEFKKIIMFSKFDCKRTIFVHSDLQNEIKLKKNQHYKTIKNYFPNYDYVAVVTEDLIEPTCQITDIKDKLVVINNIIDYKNIILKSEQNIIFDEYTESNVSINKLNDVLNSKGKKFINIGRFSFEKGHHRLIDVFNTLWKKDQSIYLIIIGGYGKLYEDTLKYAAKSIAKDNIIIIKMISNPYTILKKCDYFVLSSFYEGFGLVLVEADILGLPVISTDIIGPRNFMKKHNGMLVEDSENGLLKGMKACLNGEVKTMSVDYEIYNEKAIEQFESII